MTLSGITYHLMAESYWLRMVCKPFQISNDSLDMDNQVKAR